MKDIHITFDLETMANSSKSLIVQIAAVEFNIQGEFLREFDYRIDIREEKRFEINANTVEWWIKQAKEAQESVFSYNKNRYKLERALSDFNTFVGDRPLWSHATFDPPILMNAYNVCNIKPKAHYRSFMDIRTLNLIAGDIKVEDKLRESFGPAHDALADCKHQAHYIAAMLRKISK